MCVRCANVCKHLAAERTRRFAIFTKGKVGNIIVFRRSAGCERSDDDDNDHHHYHCRPVVVIADSTTVWLGEGGARSGAGEKGIVDIDDDKAQQRLNMYTLKERTTKGI